MAKDTILCSNIAASVARSNPDTPVERTRPPGERSHASDSTPELDLRRRHARSAESRARLTETIVGRAEHLPRPDAALILAVYRDGLAISNIAALRARGVGGLESDVAAAIQVRRRLRRLARRCTDPLFAFVALHAPSFQPTMRRVAIACILHGLSVRRAALTLNLSEHVVRRQRESLLAIFQSSPRRVAAASASRAEAVAS
jgi:hypothetical protein